MKKLINNSVFNASLDIMEALDTPLALSIAILIRYKEWDQIANKSINPKNYEQCEIDRFKRDYQAVSLLKKYQGLPTQVDPAQVAFDAFMECEAWCAATNPRFSSFIDDFFGDYVTSDYPQVLGQLELARRFIKKVLRQLPDVPEGGFGKGSTFEAEDRSADVGLTAYDKISEGWSSTVQWGDIEDAWLSQTYLYKPLAERFPTKQWPTTRGNRYFQVPKDARRNRSICIEPGANVYFQKGLGSAIRSRLRRINLNLDENQALHQELAKKGSRTGTIATIDLSNASDSVCYGLVEYLLPPDWFAALVRYRSPFTRISKGPDIWLRNSKFSSMGNGYTFELETLIFASLVAGCGGVIGDNSFVYGDDIIIPTSLTKSVTNLLQFCGFKLNSEKSFTDGVFRESCGGDYFNGVDVRPYFWKKEPANPLDWYAVHNGICARWRVDLGRSKPLAHEFIPVVERLVEQNIPRQYRLYGPPEFGDSVLNTYNTNLWVTRRKVGIRYIKTLSTVSVKKRRSKYGYSVQLASALMGFRGSLTPRGAVTGFVVKWASIV